ncbi:MAG: C39 family peptidase [Verrucomicrobiales bacterium]|nr:C39 family peptidase [Verrucomicrobiales bacterium]
MVRRKYLIVPLLTLIFFDPCHSAENEGNLSASLDPFIELPGAYLIKPADLDTMFEQEEWNHNPYFKWLTKDKSRAVFQQKKQPNLSVSLTILGGTVPIEEAIIDFKDGQFEGVTISVYNRGDGTEITPGDFEARNRAVGRHLGQQLAVRPTRRTHNPTQGLLTDGWIWISARGKAVLEHNPGAPGKTEFLRMRLARRDAGGTYEAATKDRTGATVTLSDLPRNVRKTKGGNVFISGIPMVDQGSKGYCVVASAQRLFEYYGIACDMHQLAQIANSDPDQGTSPLVINEELGSIDHFFKTRLECLTIRHTSGLVELVDDKYVGDPVSEKDFHQMISKWIDEGIPLLWGLEVGRFDEEPPLQNQTSGGHMRMIIGYNHTTGRIIFSDSWGLGHEFKTMDANDAFKATLGLFLLKPIVR